MIEIRQSDLLPGCYLVVLDGVVRAHADNLRDQLDGLVAKAQFLIYDFAAVEFVESAVLGHLLSVHEKLQKGGGAQALVHLSTDLRRQIDAIGLTRFFTICDSLQEAAAALQPSDIQGLPS